jgi:hypothetical protein
LIKISGAQMSKFNPSIVVTEDMTDLKNVMRLAFQKKKYSEGFSIIYLSQIDPYDKYIALLIHSYYSFSSTIWNQVQRSVIKNCVINVCDYNGSSYVLEDYVIGFTIIDFIKGRSPEHLDALVFEAVFLICLSKYLSEVEKLIELSRIINRHIKFDMYDDCLIKTCEKMNYDQGINFLLKDSVRNPDVGVVSNLIKMSGQALQKQKYQMQTDQNIE